MPVQYFLLDSNATGYADALTDLATDDAANYSFTPTQTLRDADHDSTLKLVKANISTAQRDTIFGSTYPTELVRHRWDSLESFRISGFHILAETERSVFGEASRTYQFVRPQQDYGETADNYGAGDGSTHYDARNGLKDVGTLATGVDVFVTDIDDGVHYAWDDGSIPANAVTDASGLGAAGRQRLASDPDWPGMIWGSRRAWDDDTALPFEEYDGANNIYVCGGYRNGGSAYSGGSFLEFDVEDKTQDLITLLKRHTIYGKSNLSDLNGTTGRSKLYAPPANSSDIWDASLTFDGTSTWDDVTIDSRASPADSIIVPTSAANDHAFYVGDVYRFSDVYLRGTDTAGGLTVQPQVGGTFIPEYYNGSTWATLPTYTDNTSGLTALGQHLYFVPPSDWAQTTVNSLGPYYFIRWRKTGGTVTQACHLEWWSRGDAEPWDGVRTFDGSSTYTDVTWECLDADSDDIEAFSASAADNAALMWCSTKQFSEILVNLSQVRVGGTFVLEYSTGSGGWSSFSNSSDPTSGLSSGTSEQTIEFNPKSDWATDTIDSLTGYWVRLRKTGGTVTTAARMDSSRGFYERSVYVHRWNDGAPVNGWSNTEEASSSGIHFETTGKGNFELFRLRSIGIQLFDVDTDEVFICSSQYALGGALQSSSGTQTWTLQATPYGTRWWSIADHEHQDKTDAFIANIIARIQYAIDNLDNATVDSETGNTIGEDLTADLLEAGITDPDVTVFDDMEDWSDLALFGEGMYGSGSSQWTKIFDGCKERYMGGSVYNDEGDRLYYPYVIDGHSDAMYGPYDGVGLGSQFKRLGIERHNRAIDYYPQGEGSNDKPIVSSGSGANRRRMRFQYGYCSTWSGEDDGDFMFGIGFESDPDAGNYEDGTGLVDDNHVTFWGFKDTVKSDGVGSAILNTTPQCVPKVRCCEFDNVGTAHHIAGGFSNNGPRSTNAVTFDGGSTYNDITENVKDTGNTATELFAGTGSGNILYLGVNTGFVREFIFDITTAAAGSPTLAVEYYNGSSWTAVSNLSDGTSGLTVDGTLSFDRPTDATTVSIDGDSRYWVRIRVASGSFSTIPQAQEIGTVVEAAGIDTKHNTIRNCPGAGDDGYIINMFMGVGTALTNSGVIIEDHNEIILGGGQDSSTQFYRINGVNNYTLASWQAFSKPAATTSAEQDGIFGTSTSLT